ncbi:MAG: sugar-binding transcriptional regulator [Chloroflexi bacterium]|nr:sugar-binding transcriptional regulator [Chloroflexota bacterium]
MINDDSRLLTKAATLYYKAHLTQAEIARRLGISRQLVGRLLKRAREQGVVEIRIRPSPSSFFTDLEHSLETAWGLREALVVAPTGESDESIKEALGQAAAAFLAQRVSTGVVVGLSWGSTLYQCAQHMAPTPTPAVRVVQINGSLNRTTHPTHAEYIIHRVSAAFGAEPNLLPAPLIVDRPDIKASLVSDSLISAVLDLGRRATICVFGIGSLSGRSSLYTTGHITEDLLRTLEASGSVGDICGRFYDHDGKPSAPDLEERTIAIELSDLRSKGLSVGVAGGRHKLDAIRGALRGRYCTVLITDKETAEALLRS